MAASRIELIMNLLYLSFNLLWFEISVLKLFADVELTIVVLYRKF